MKTNLTLLIILICAALPAMSQSRIKGKIVEKGDQGAAYATIALIAASDSSVVKGAVTDESGVFEIDNIANGNYLVNVQYVGYKKKWSPPVMLTDSVTSVDLGNLVLEENVESLAEVTVKGQRSLVEQKGDRMILNVEKSVIAKGNKVTDLLKYAPLVRVTNEGIKVGNKGSVLILVDGRQTGQGALASFLQNFSAEDILKIEVLTNPPAKYDASFGAVIDIITKKSLEVGLNGRVAVNYSQGEYGRFTPDGSLNFRTRKWNLFTSASGAISDYYNDQFLERQFPGSSLTNNVNSLDQNKSISSFNGIDFTPNSRHALGLRLNGSWSDKDGENKTKTSFRGPSSVLDSLLQVTNRSKENGQTYDVNFYYTGKLDSTGKELSVNVTQSFFNKSSVQNLAYQRQSPGETPIGAPSRVRITNPNDQKSFIAQTDLSIPFKKGKWGAGLKYISIGNDNELRQENYDEGLYVLDTAFSNAGIYREHTYAGYTSYSNALGNDWSLQAGLRLEHTSQELTSAGLSRTYTGLFPSMNLSKGFKNESNFSISYSRKIARPSLYSLVPFRTVVDPYSIVEGNPLLKPSFANTADIYYTFGNISLFANYTHTKNMISDVLFADTETKIYIQTMGNLSSVNDAYAGISWGQDIAKWWKTNTTFTISGTQTKSRIADVPGVKLNGYGAVVNSTNIFNLAKGYKAELFLNYNSPNRYTIWKSRSLYWVSLSVNKELSKSVNIRIAFEDIFRTQVNRIHVGYGPVDIRSRLYSDAQRVRVSLSYNFGKRTVKGSKYRSLGNEAEKNRMGGR
ncbi:TonB-dependent receptor family protein [Dyadobacter sp. LJ53]|uniref:outer membrane beta-barrel protein n=1 Tax=Dyadobacter chenwenxiniae TaxID=2906456 RepID=UPI001F43B1EE|nr:outer membrane beta-barrel protein [Dyadobacter chenwenxiniae]MCF0052407.1 TonB-dependent receptor family protein [Dyadobacter chenwenxiniae]